MNTVPDWLLLARGEVGIKTQMQIAEYRRLVGVPPSPWWCSAFVGWCMVKAGHSAPRDHSARSWLTWGVELNEPRVGCIVPIWRGAPHLPLGHVGFLEEGSNGLRLLLLGGQQLLGDSASAVSVEAFALERRLSFRWPVLRP